MTQMLSIRTNKLETSTVTSSPAASPTLGVRSNKSGVSIIGADLSIVGNIVSGSELHIEGTVQGDIQGVNVLVRDTAKITGNIIGQHVIVQGRVMGSVKSDRLALAASCKLEGDVYHQSLSVEPGAFFEGKSMRGSAQTSPSASNPGLPAFGKDGSAAK